MFRRRSLDWNNYKAKQMVTNRVLFDFLSQYLSFSVITLSTPVVQWCGRSLHLNEAMGLGKKKKISQTHLANAKCLGLRSEMCFVGMGRRYEAFPSMHWLVVVVGSDRVGRVTHENKQIYSLFVFFPSVEIFLYLELHPFWENTIKWLVTSPTFNRRVLC